MAKRDKASPNVVEVKKLNNVVPTDRFRIFKMKLLEAKTKKDPDEAILKLCVKENKEFRKQFDSLTTVRRYYTFYRNVCREVLDEKTLAMCLEILNLTPQEMLEINEQYSKKVKSEHQNLRPLKNYELMIEKAVGLLGGLSIYDRILGLACLTGRRSAEIGCTAKFQSLRKDWMLFDGQLKGKTRTIRTYEMPVLADGALILDAIKSVREQRPQWIENTILFHACGSRELSLRVKRHFSDFIDNPTVKDLRAAYAEICYDKFGTIKTGKSCFFSNILGHDEADNVTGQSYLDFYIAERATA